MAELDAKISSLCCQLGQTIVSWCSININENTLDGEIYNQRIGSILFSLLNRNK